MLRSWRKTAVMLAMGITLAAGVRAAGNSGLSAGSACRFIQYYQALETKPLGLWERVLYSVFLASAPQPKAKSPGTPATSS